MALPKYLQAARQRAWAERKTVTWAGLALLSRLAPLSAVPIMLHFSTVRDADDYALILANAGILSIIMSFGQVSNMQSRFSVSGFSSIAVQGIITALTASLILSIGAAFIYPKFSDVAINILFSLSMALTAQYNTLLRCTNNFLAAIWSEIIRVSLFFSSVLLFIKTENLNYVTMSILMIIYYIIPYMIMFFNVRIGFAGIREAIGESWSDRSRLFYWTLSASLAAGAWVAIRYVVAIFGADGDLAKFSAIMSICSAGVILTDLLYVRISRTIVTHAEGNRMSELHRLMKMMIAISAAGFAFLILISSAYIYFALGAERNLLLLSIFLSLGYLFRFFYVFGQNILIGRGVATYDLLGGIAMMLVALTVSFLLVPSWGVVGAGVAFLSTAVAMLVVIAWGVRRHWVTA